MRSLAETTGIAFSYLRRGLRPRHHGELGLCPLLSPPWLSMGALRTDRAGAAVRVTPMSTALSTTREMAAVRVRVMSMAWTLTLLVATATPCVTGTPIHLT